MAAWTRTSAVRDTRIVAPGWGGVRHVQQRCGVGQLRVPDGGSVRLCSRRVRNLSTLLGHVLSSIIESGWFPALVG